MDGIRQFLGAASRWLVEDFGLLGLFAVAFLDSSFLSLPEVNDILVVTMSVREPERFWLFALVAALGSVCGCLALYSIGRKGGQALLRWRLGPQRLERLQRVLRRFDVLAVLVPSLLPPPCPFKVFVLSSGAFGMKLHRFVLAVLVGRSVRYFTEAWLAVRYGNAVFAYLRTYALDLGLLAIAVLLSVWLVRRVLARSRHLAPSSGERT